MTGMHIMPFIFENKNTQTYLVQLRTAMHLLPCARSATSYSTVPLPVIGADTLFFDPELVGLLGGVRTYIDSFTISCNISRGMSNTMILLVSQTTKVVVFPPDLRIIEAKSNGVGAGGCCSMDGPICGFMSSSALPISARSSGCNGGSESTSSLESSNPRIFKICKIR
jgi:hypothetical protein